MCDGLFVRDFWHISTCALENFMVKVTEYRFLLGMDAYRITNNPNFAALKPNIYSRLMFLLSKH